jgi:O-antigen ligase
VPHGLAIGLVIVAAIAAGIAIFGRRVLSRVVNGVLCSSLLGGTIFFLYQSGALQRFFTFQTTDGRMSFWTYALGFMHGHAFFSGVGLGCWPLVSGTFPSHPWELHVHNAYLELYINIGVIGVIALICFVVVGAKLGSDIIHSLKKHPYYGLGIGVLLAIVAVALASVFESASFGLPVVIGDAYYYVLSPIPLLLAALLVIAHQLLKQPEAPG